MKLPQTVLQHVAVLSFLLAAAIPSCQCPAPPQQGDEVSATGDAPLWEAIPIGRDLFAFKWEEVRRFEVARRDPAAPGDTWELTLAKDLAGPDPRWTIDSLARDGSPDPVDRLADTTFVNHLVDTLGTLRAEKPVTDLDEGATGLLDPHWRLRWETEGGQAFELRLGAPLENGATYGQVANPRDAAARSRIFTIRGAALEMLSRVTSLEVLRLRVITPFGSDDVDVLEIGGSAGTPFFAQRQGAAWADRRNRPLQNESAVHDFLEQLVHLRARTFEEASERAGPILSAVRKSPLHEAKFTDRQGNVTRLSIGRWRGGLWAAIDGRDDTAFELYPETENIFARRPAQR